MDMVKVKIGGKVRLMLKLKKNSSESRRHIVSVTIARYSTPRLHYGCSSYRRRDMALAGTYTVFQKTFKILFLITLLNFHQL